MDNEVKLKSCPFCGSDANLLWNYVTNRMEVRCLNVAYCDARVVGFIAGDHAANAWNKRAKLAHLQERLDEAEKVVDGWLAIGFTDIYADEMKATREYRRKVSERGLGKRR